MERFKSESLRVSFSPTTRSQIRIVRRARLWSGFSRASSSEHVRTQQRSRSTAETSLVPAKGGRKSLRALKGLCRWLCDAPVSTAEAPLAAELDPWKKDRASHSVFCCFRFEHFARKNFILPTSHKKAGPSLVVAVE